LEILDGVESGDVVASPWEFDVPLAHLNVGQEASGARLVDQADEFPHFLDGV